MIINYYIIVDFEKNGNINFMKVIKNSVINKYNLNELNIIM